MLESWCARSNLAHAAQYGYSKLCYITLASIYINRMHVYGQEHVYIATYSHIYSVYTPEWCATRLPNTITARELMRATPS